MFQVHRHRVSDQGAHHVHEAANGGRGGAHLDYVYRPRAPHSALQRRYQSPGLRDAFLCPCVPL